MWPSLEEVHLALERTAISRNYNDPH